MLVFLQVEYGGKCVWFPYSFHGNKCVFSSKENKWVSFFLKAVKSQRKGLINLKEPF